MMDFVTSFIIPQMVSLITIACDTLDDFAKGSTSNGLRRLGSVTVTKIIEQTPRHT